MSFSSQLSYPGVRALCLLTVPLLLCPLTTRLGLAGLTSTLPPHTSSNSGAPTSQDFLSMPQRLASKPGQTQPLGLGKLPAAAMLPPYAAANGRGIAAAIALPVGGHLDSGALNGIY